MSHSYAPVAPAPDSQPTHLATASPRRRRLALSSRSWGALAAAAVILALFGSLHEPTRRHTTSAAKATLAGIWPAEEVDERTQLRGRYEKMLARVMLHPEQPPESWKDQVVPGEQYLFSNFFGGQTNQLMIKLNALSAAKDLGAVALIPSFVALHFKGHSHRPIDRMYDMPRFYNLTGLRAVPLDRFKAHNLTAASVEPDRVTCWTYAAYSSPKAPYLPPPARFLSEYGISLDYSYPDPQTLSTPVGQPVRVEDIVAFLANGTGQAGWIERNRVEQLPEAPSPAFDPASIPPRSPDEQVHCVDALYYLKSRWPSTWGDVGQHLHFLPEVQTAAQEYLRVLLEVPEGQDIPPYISVHVRGTDFRTGHGSISSSSFVEQVAEVRKLVAKRLKDFESGVLTASSTWPAPRSFMLTPEEYPVVFTSDEHPTSAFWHELEGHGWKGVDHIRFNTTERFDPWYPSLIDGAVLSGAEGIVGTAASTYSAVSGERVKSWQGGVYVEAQLAKT
ncbi:hypothetical protein NBRC10512_004323 [Rhodotorula toruloides]|uniref:RHTO0S12e01750g1_1 n=2 Tax=Rhodotorula toruloides TaxID=5286 RepID=A0A061B8H8_RHOTO|nr:uncharacterized protein RHTO_07604 [Rhodotorula toruloides NP11]EMS23262.1 hypothetical protein RHTO_07604 [Rhodotorula toruloides NP11]CDR46224.1 RHTO0S12e01750g1_1 [Rhodotorula toruloides]